MGRMFESEEHPIRLEVMAMSFEQFDLPVRRCLARIDSVIQREIQGACIQVVSQGAGGRICLALVVHGHFVAMNFVSDAECREAYLGDKHECASIDNFTRNWIRVARVKLNDIRSMTEISRRARAMFIHSASPAEPAPLAL